MYSFDTKMITQTLTRMLYHGPKQALLVQESEELADNTYIMREILERI